MPWVKLAQIYIKIRNFKMARMAVYKSFKINPNNLAVLKIKAFYHLKIGQYDKANQIYQLLDIHFHNQLEQIKIQEGVNSLNFKQLVGFYRMNKFNLSETEFFLGNYLSAFKNYEYRNKIIQDNFIELKNINLLQKISELSCEHLSNPKNQNILILSEQGYGDQIMILRYLKTLDEMGFKITFIVNKALIKLFKCFSQLSNIIIKEKVETIDLLENDLISWSMSLPSLFYKINNKSQDLLDLPTFKNTKLNNIDKITNKKRKKIGICWRGSPKNKRDTERSLDPQLFYKIFQNKNYNFFVFQKEINDSDKLVINKFPNIVCLSEVINDFYDSSCILSSMDQVITVDTSILHLSGTLKKKTIALLPYVPDPRWKIEGGKFWYKSVEFISQKKLNDWSYPIKKILTILK
jgi:ADP-heptose:LPS heptosyltransferase